MVRSPRPPSSAFLVSLAVLFVLLHAILAVTATAEKSTTADEIGHLAAGLAYNTRADYRLQPENGNLPQRWAALPLTIAGMRLPPPTTAAWNNGDVWRYGHAFFYEGGLSTGEFLFLGRGCVALVSAATGLLVFFWSRALFGWRGAFLSLALFVFCPAFLAHGALATSDVVMTFFFLAALGAWWRHLRHPGVAGAALSALVLGLAFVAKFSAVLLPPMFGLVALAWVAKESRPGGWRAPLLRLARTTAVHALAVWAVIWMFYGFRFSAFAPAFAADASFNHSWSWILDGLGFPGKVIELLRDHRILPEAWLYGLAFVLGFSEARGAFLSGQHSLTGWVGFFPFAFLVKTTLPLLALLATGVFVATRDLVREKTRAVSGRLYVFVPLAALFLVYGVTSLTSHLNIGHRHILPLYPVLFISAGYFGRWLDFRRPAAAAAIALLVGWHALESFRIRPHYLAYFNPLAGGPENGWRHLVDSSLDWGQDLPALSAWLRREAPKEKVFLSYFGTGDPEYEGIAAERLPCLPEPGGRKRAQAKFAPGIYAVSATMLQHAYAPRDLVGPWTLPLELEFQKLHAIEPALLAHEDDPAARTALLRDPGAGSWELAWRRYEALRFTRLCCYLRVRKLDANAGYSILIFRLTPEEVAAVTGSSAEWSALIERAAASTH